MFHADSTDGASVPKTPKTTEIKVDIRLQRAVQFCLVRFSYQVPDDVLQINNHTANLA